MRQLAVELRPRNFGQLIGLGSQTSAIVARYEKSEPSAWLFSGPTGTGKTTLARILAVSLNCPHGKIGYPCKDCYESRYQYAIREVNASEMGGVDSIGELAKGTDYRPQPPTRRRVIILDEAQRLSAASQNLLLKYFEDTARATVWIVCTTEKEKILKTLQGRCTLISTQSLTSDSVYKFVEDVRAKLMVMRQRNSASTIGSSKEITERLVRADVRAPRVILNVLEAVWLDGQNVKKVIRELSSGWQGEAIVKCLQDGDWNGIRKQLKRAQTTDYKEIRIRAAAYLRGVLLEQIPGPQAGEYAEAIRLLASVRQDEFESSATAAALYQAVQQMGVGDIEG